MEELRKVARAQLSVVYIMKTLSQYVGNSFGKMNEAVVNYASAFVAVE